VKIALIAPPGGGIATGLDRGNSVTLIVGELARRLGRRHEVVIYGGRRRGEPARESVSPRVVIHRVSQGQRALHEALVRVIGARNPAKPYFASQRYYRRYWRQVAQALPASAPDVIHLHGLLQHVAALRASSPEAKLVLHMHGESLAQLDHNTVERQLRDVDLVVACSEFISEAIRGRFPEHADRCTTLYNGVDVERFSPADGPPRSAGRPGRLLYVGRISPEKGIHVLLEAFERVRAAHPTCQLRMIGQPELLPYSFVVGPSRDALVSELSGFYRPTPTGRLAHGLLFGRSSYLRALRSTLSPETHAAAEFAGGLPHAELPECYRAADVFVFPSVWEEAFGVPVIEAMACGLPVVATRGGAFREIVEEGQTGLLVPRGDAAALSDAICQLLADPEGAAAMGQRGRARVLERFSWDRLSDMLEAYYASPKGRNVSNRTD
jgi:glycosyltransferase involved in cell wall biosynthesis